jgi:hypothetical protein
MAITLQSKVIRSNEPVTAPVDDELVMADIDAGKYYGLNGGGTTIWKFLEKGISVEDLCKNLCNVYEVTNEQCSVEVLAFLKDLKDRGLINII